MKVTIKKEFIPWDIHLITVTFIGRKKEGRE